jgi:hypothetical protein
MSGLWRGLGVATAATLTFLVPAPVRGQVEVSVQPRLSSVVPIANLREVSRTLGSDSDPWDREVSATTISRSPALSIAIQVGDPSIGWLLRSGFTRSLGSTALVHGVLDPTGPGQVGPPPYPPDQTFRFELPSTLTVGFAEVVLPLLIGTSTVRPYVSAGAALKRYEFGPFDPSSCESVGGSCDVVEFSVPFDGTVLGAQVGAGLRFAVWSKLIEIGVVDAFNDYGGQTKHDLNVFLGMGIALIG